MVGQKIVTDTDLRTLLQREKGGQRVMPGMPIFENRRAKKAKGEEEAAKKQ